MINLILRKVHNKKGLGIVEALIAVFITAVAIMSVFALVSPAWKSVGKSDKLGRASGIMYDQLMKQEARLMNPCCRVTEGPLPVNVVNASGHGSIQPGDAQFNVSTTITSLQTNVWRVTVRVDWPGHPGISDSLLVNIQDGFLYPLTCNVGETACL